MYEHEEAINISRSIQKNSVEMYPLARLRRLICKSSPPTMSFTNAEPLTRRDPMAELDKRYIEVFSDADLSGLREDLMKAGLDSWQAADLISSFLVARGYGVSTQDARLVTSRMEAFVGSLKCLQAELEKLAYVM